MAKKKIGFKCGWMPDEDAGVLEQVAGDSTRNSVLDDLRERIVETTLYMAGEEFAALLPEAKAKIILGYNLDVQVEYKMTEMMGEQGIVQI